MHSKIFSKEEQNLGRFTYQQLLTLILLNSFLSQNICELKLLVFAGYKTERLVLTELLVTYHHKWHSVTPLSAGGGGEPPPKFSKKEGGSTGPQLLNF